MMSRADAPNSSPAQSEGVCHQAEPTAASSSPAVATLVASVPSTPHELPPAAPTPLLAAHNNAQRTGERAGVAPYASAGETAAADSVYVGAALVKGRDPSGAEAEVLSVSAQIGAQSEVQLGFQRVAGTSGALAGSVETFALRAQVGIHNDDGSTGLNIGASATLIGFEGSIGSASSVTYGVGAGAGAAASVGTRDADHDGSTELCARLSFGPVTVGACLENPL